MRFLRARNPRLADRFSSIADIYANHGRRLSVRWDYAFFQMQIETASLSFRRPDGKPADVAPAQNNFAGLGAVGNGTPGETFATMEQGVRAHLEHVLIYAGRKIETPVAERTRKVQIWKVLEPWHAELARPVTFSDLAHRWSPGNPDYARAIAILADRFYAANCTSSETAGTPRLLAEPFLHKSKALPKRMAVAGFVPALPRPRKQLPITRTAPATAPPSRRPTPSRTTVSRPKPTAEDKIRALVSGRTVHIRTSFGAVIPVDFKANGQMRGEAGSLGFILGASSDRGKWWVEKGKLCQKWRIWLRRKARCIRLRKRGGIIYWRSDDGRTGTARIAAR